MTISLILAESALEMIPRSISSHPAVASHARRTGSPPSRMLLDNSWHYAAMKNLQNAEKRGRPDLVHICMISATSAPIYQRYNALKIYVHTFDNHIIHLGCGVRIPKSYHRFAGLVESLYETGSIYSRGARTLGGRGSESDSDKVREPLIVLKRGQTFADLIREQRFSRVVGLSTAGVILDPLRPLESVARRIMGDAITIDADADAITTDHHTNQNCNNTAAVVVGGFQKGHFSDAVLKHVDELYSVDEHPLEAHVVIARMLYECEKKPFM